MTDSNYKSDTEAFLRQRRNLIAFSIAILVFVFAGGELDKASLLGGSLSIERRWVVYLFVITGFVYTFWRYWLYAPSIRVTFTGDFNQAPFVSNFYKRFARRMYRKNGMPISVSMPVIRFLDGNYCFDLSQQISVGGGSSSTQGEGRLIISSNEYTALKLAWFSTMIFKLDGFSRLMLPYILGFFAAVALLVRLSISTVAS